MVRKTNIEHTPKKIKRKRKAEKVATGNEIAPRADHDPSWDLDTMMRAEEIRADKKRHGAVKKEAKKRHHTLKKVMKGPADEREMREYASRRSPKEGMG